MRSPVLLIFTKNTCNICSNEIRKKMHIFNVKSVRDKNVYMESLKYLYIN
jgi:recombinational DNA repair protein RecR